MKRAHILCLFVLICLNAGQNAGQCDTTMFPPLQPLSSKGFSNPTNNDLTNPDDQSLSNDYLSDSSVSYPKISEIERSLYGQNFTNQDILVRLARIEKSLFNTSYANLSLAQRVDNIVVNFNQINQFPNISKNTLSGMEARVFKRSFVENDIENRVERLEQQVFGAVQSGDVTARFETLKTAVKNYNANSNMTAYSQNQFRQNPMMQNPMGQIPTTGNRGGWKSALGGLGSMLLGGGMYGGTMTGFTPPIDPFNNYNTNSYNNNNGYNNFANMGSPSGYGQYNGYRSNHGYSDSFSNYGSGSKVTIID